MGAFIWWLLVGLAAGALAKSITPQKEKGGWISSLIVGLLGSMIGGWVFGLFGFDVSGIIGSVLAALIGALLLLFIYYKFLADKLNLPI
ncbi:MAG TPA: GlsB/YeaQ/YmgE family stress response membrane protein [Saprospiraceae bacterium]|nr:GlsB/YeaQ/YmgE family stress response membrane protein [Saprospiraceae bacterium]